MTNIKIAGMYLISTTIIIKHRILKPKFSVIYVVLGIGLPVAVYAVYVIFVPGDFIVHHFSTLNDILHTFFWAIFVTAIGGAVVEEMVCRGLLMGYIEKKTNINIAIISTAIFLVPFIY